MAISSISELNNVAGSNTEIQYNNSGVFGASSNLTFDGSTLTVTGDLSVAGNYTNSAQPAFLVTLTATPSNVTGDGTSYTVAFETEVYDQGSDFNTGTYTFTAPVTGRYLLSAHVLGSNIDTDAGHSSVEFGIITSNRTYGTASPPNNDIGATHGRIVTVLADMDASDTAYCYYKVSGGTKTCGLGYGATYDYFSAYLVC